MNCVSIAPTSPSHRRSVELIDPTSIVAWSIVRLAVNVLQPLSPRMRPLPNETVGGLAPYVGAPAISTTRHFVPSRFGGWVAADPGRTRGDGQAGGERQHCPSSPVDHRVLPSTPRC